jgi:hypothetical protein
MDKYSAVMLSGHKPQVADAVIEAGKAPGSRAGLLPSSPLRTARASFPACRSSLSNAPCGTR